MEARRGRAPRAVCSVNAPREPKLGWRTLALTDELVAAFLTKEIGRSYKPTVMLASSSRMGRSHLRLYRDSKGYFVRCGRRGSLKQYLGRCNVTYLGGEPTLFAFTTADQDAFDADQDRRWNLKHGITA